MKKKLLFRLLCIALVLGVLGLSAVLILDSCVRRGAEGRILSAEDAAALEDIDCILVLGCLVHDSGRPSDMLRDRLQRGVELYTLGAAPKLLMSGDHGRPDYNEVGAMKQYATDAGIPSADVFMDHAGFSTYESIYRARDVFEADRIVIVTQEYHLYRALHIADALGIEAWGVAADYHTYVGQPVREAREILARAKDFLQAAIQPKPTFLGEVISIAGNGDETNDEVLP